MSASSCDPRAHAGTPGTTAPGGVAPGGAALAWLGHPVTVLALAALAVNDHLLKGLAPSPLTGKLSDVAGLLLAPPLLVALLAVLAPRLGGGAGGRAADRVAAAAVIATGLGFTLVKTSSVGARLASQAWTVVAGPSQVLVDATDLLALPALGVAWWLWLRVRHRPLGAEVVRLVRIAVLLPVAVVMVAATTATPTQLPAGVDAVGLWRDRVAIYAPVQERYVSSFWISSDGGATWRLAGLNDTQRAELDDLLRVTPAAPGASPRERRSSECVPDEPGRCYRVVPGQLRVEESRDGGATWAVAWELPAGRREFLRRAVSAEDLGRLGGIELVVQPQGDGHAVVVATGRDGLVIRDTAGNWKRRGIPDPDSTSGGFLPPIALTAPGQRINREYLAGIAAGALVLAIGLFIAHGWKRRGWVATGFNSVIPLGIGLLAVAWVPRDLPGMTSAGTLSAIGLLLALLGLAGSVRATARAGTFGRQGRERLRLWILIGLATLTGALVVLPFVGWTVATPDLYDTAVRMSIACGLIGFVSTVVLVRLLGRRWPGTTRPPRSFRR